jgi:hypothetical protein
MLRVSLIWHQVTKDSRLNYAKIYEILISRARTRVLFGQIEMHHIIPRSEGGSNKKENKIELSPKEHHLCHLLLIRMGKCLKYCYRHVNIREYIKMKEDEKRKIKVRESRKMYKERHWLEMDDENTD